MVLAVTVPKVIPGAELGAGVSIAKPSVCLPGVPVGLVTVFEALLQLKVPVTAEWFEKLPAPLQSIAPVNVVMLFTSGIKLAPRLFPGSNKCIHISIRTSCSFPTYISISA